MDELEGSYSPVYCVEILAVYTIVSIHENSMRNVTILYGAVNI